jgi:tetratricopeptide (TPR) repeat protein
LCKLTKINGYKDDRFLTLLQLHNRNRASRFQSLGAGLHKRYQRTGHLADLDQAIHYFYQAVEATPDHHPDRASRFQNLGVGLRDRYEREGYIDDLDQAIQYYQQAIDATPDNHPDRVSQFQSLGKGLRKRYQRTGQVDDLNRAIHYFQQAVDVTPDHHPDQAARFQSLGIGLRDRYKRTGHVDDLDQVIQYLQQAINATPDNHPDRASRFKDLGTGLHDRYQRTGQVNDLDRAIQYYQQALDATPDNHPDRAGRFQSLGAGLANRYQRTDQVDDLNRAIQYFQQAINATPDNHLDQARWFQSLGTGLHDRYQRTSQVDDLDRAIQYYQQAIDATPDNDPDQATRFQSLGVGLHHRYERTGHMSDLINSTEKFKVSFKHPFGFPATRINSGKRAVQNLIEEKKWGDSAQIMERILQLLPQVALPTGSRSDLQHFLRTFAGVASLAASILLKAGEPPFRALQALERGRGIIASLMMDARSDISELRDQYPQLWSRYTKCRDQIALLNEKRSFTSRNDQQLLDLTRSNQRQQLTKALNDLQIEIRQCPGFERFLLPPTEQGFRNMAQDGSLVCFNVSSISSEAFLVTTDGIQVLDLPDLKENNIQHGVKLFASRGNFARRDASLCESDKEEDEEEENTSTLDMQVELLSLWKHAVRPVLNRLRLFGQKVTTHSLSRIWWVGGGSMALMPLHAAGNHKLGSTENTLSHVISSYASTFKSLQFIQDKPPFSILNSDSKQEILVVSMPVTPDGHSILKVSGEVTAIQNQSKSWASILYLDRPGRESVMNALKSCNIAHFACHAAADRIEPAKSALLLGRDVLEKLTLEDMDAISHGQAQIAYLSACSTAEIKVKNLADESIHLASAFQLAGFTHVIGTLWAANDDAAVKIASNFYEGLNLFDRGGRGLVAQALHHAVLRYRNEQDNNLAVMKWAPFIHIGC